MVLQVVYDLGRQTPVEWQFVKKRTATAGEGGGNLARPVPLTPLAHSPHAPLGSGQVRQVGQVGQGGQTPPTPTLSKNGSVFSGL